MKHIFRCIFLTSKHTKPSDSGSYTPVPAAAAFSRQPRPTMAPNSTIHIIRHGQGYHQLANDEPDTKLHDPALTTHGIKECQGFCVEFPYHSQIDLVCASPLQRTIQTAGLAFQPETERGLKVIAVPDAQEGTDALSDTGSKKDFLKEKFGDLVDYNLLVGKWYEKTGDQAVDTKSLRERAKRLRIWLRSRKEENIVVVTHGFFAHFITGHIDEKGEQFGMSYVLRANGKMADCDRRVLD